MVYHGVVKWKWPKTITSKTMVRFSSSFFPRYRQDLTKTYIRVWYGLIWYGMVKIAKKCWSCINYHFQTPRIKMFPYSCTKKRLFLRRCWRPSILPTNSTITCLLHTSSTSAHRAPGQLTENIPCPGPEDRDLTLQKYIAKNAYFIAPIPQEIETESELEEERVPTPEVMKKEDEDLDTDQVKLFLYNPNKPIN